MAALETIAKTRAMATRGDRAKIIKTCLDTVNDILASKAVLCKTVWAPTNNMVPFTKLTPCCASFGDGSV